MLQKQLLLQVSILCLHLPHHDVIVLHVRFQVLDLLLVGLQQQQSLSCMSSSYPISASICAPVTADVADLLTTLAHHDGATSQQ